jgi:aminoglycoside phosphotransferase (APT) family kinase protein
VLPSFEVAAGARVAPLGSGLINDTFEIVEPGPGRRLVLQRVNPIFPAAVHLNIRAVTTRLQEFGLATPLLIPTRDGAPCLELPPTPAAASGAPGGTSASAKPGPVWRIMTFVDGLSFDVVGSLAQARAAGRLIAQFHRALEGLSHTFVGMRTGVHDTSRHLQTLADAATAGARDGHRLMAAVTPLAAEIAARAADLPALPSIAPRIGHGDLKFNNVLFAGAAGEDRERAVCLIDLDTVGPQPLAFELGDAWRSWCNARGEDEPEAQLDLGVFEASLDGYLSAFGAELPAAERRALLLGPEWVSLELAARFAADAVNESYFGWNQVRFAGRGEHNLVRARGQLSLHRAFVESRPRRARLLALSPET